MPDSGDELPSTGEYGGIQSQSYQKTGDKWNIVDLFDLTVDVDFNQAAGEVMIQSAFYANLPVEKGRFELFAPELGQLHEKGQGAGITIQIGERLTPFASTSVTMGRGQSQKETSVLKLTEPGYYQVFVVVEDMDEENMFTEDGAFIDSKALKHFWIWYDGDVVEKTEEFELDRFPETVSIQSGPFVTKGEDPRVIYTPSVKTETTLLSQNGFIQVLYTNPVTMTTEPMRNVRVDMEVYDWLELKVVWEQTYYTDHNGEAGDVCYDPNSWPVWEEIRYFVYADNPVTRVERRIANSNNFTAQVTGTTNPACDQTITLSAGPTPTTHTFAWINKSVEVGSDILNRTRGKIQVRIDPNVSNSSYSPSQDRITLQEDHADGSPFGNFVIAHEYGHAFHSKALDVNITNHQCPSPHYFDGPHNLSCAYIEGFANYYGAITVNNIYTTRFATNFYYPGIVRDSQNDGDPNDGSIIEGAVAAFLYDITDPANESHDNVEYPGNYLSQVIESCQVREGSNWRQANGIDHIIACLEEQMPDYSNYFDTRSTIPNNFSVTSTKPSGWSRPDIESLWKHNLYGEN